VFKAAWFVLRKAERRKRINAAGGAMFWNKSVQLVDADAQQLSRCAVGDCLKLWTRPNYEWINAYRPGTVGERGRVGSLVKADHLRIAKILDEGHPVWLEVEHCSGHAVRLGFLVENHVEIVADRLTPAGLLQHELKRKVRLARPMCLEVRASKHYQFRIGQGLEIAVPPIEEFALHPGLDVPFRSLPDGAPLRATAAAPVRMFLLRAHFTGLILRAVIVGVSAEPSHEGDRTNVWREASATARINFIRI
jgi:hypothetical protein